MPEPFSLHGKRIWVAGHNGLVGLSLMRQLRALGHTILTASKTELDCRNQTDVLAWMTAHKPEVIILAAAKVGGIGANINEPASFIYDNMMIEANIIHGAYLNDVQKLLFLGSSCIYPKDAINPIKPAALLSGKPEETNAPYAIAKIAGIELCKAYRSQYGCNFISAIPCNLYGLDDKYDTDRSHVIPALIKRAHAAKLKSDRKFSIWGSGKPLREFLYSDDLAKALLMLLENYNAEEPVNIGSSQEITIYDLARMILNGVGLEADIEPDISKPDGIARKLLDSSVMYQMGWRPEISLQTGLQRAYQDYLNRYSA